MKNLDLLKQHRLEFAENFREALEKKDDKKLAEAFQKFSDDLQQSIIEVEAEFNETADRKILAARGIRQLTSVEQKFWDNFCEAAKAGDAKAALTGIDNTFPITFIESVIGEVTTNHPLLEAMNFVNTTALTKWIYHDGSAPLATWDKITAAIAAEMGGSIGDFDFSTSKLAAFIPVPQDLLELGASYVDAYAREILAEATANGLEYGFVKGSGKNQPIAMIKDLSAGVTEGVYADKEKVALNSFEPEEYCGKIGDLAQRPNGTYRTIASVALIVNPKDYITKVIPGTTARATDGTFRNEIFPFPTHVIQSAQLAEGDAILGICDANGKIINYKPFFAGQKANIEYSDEYQWLEDNRVYKTKLFAYGFPVDNNSFLYLDISNLKATALKVKVVELPASDNNNSESDVTEAVPTYSEVSEPTGNPSTSGYYELVNGSYVLSEDTEVDSEKTYYTLDE